VYTVATDWAASLVTVTWLALTAYPRVSTFVGLLLVFITVT